jgi:hypothetical protein
MSNAVAVARTHKALKSTSRRRMPGRSYMASDQAKSPCIQMQDHKVDWEHQAASWLST